MKAAPATGTRTAVRRTFVLLALTLAAMFVWAPVSQASEGDSQVLAPSAMPKGYSLTAMARASAQFVTSGNNLAYYPATPFQVLYAASFNFTPDGAGLDVSGSNTFTVRHNTMFYVPIFQADDSPPVAGVFPTTDAGGRAYMFDQSQLGVTGSHISIDGEVTTVGRTYVAGPLDTPPLLDGGGTHEVQLAAFLSRLEPGTHTVLFEARESGAAFMAATGLAFVQERFTYTVNVLDD